MPDDPRLKLTIEDLELGATAATYAGNATSLMRFYLAFQFMQAQAASSNLEPERLSGEQPLFPEVNT